MPSRLSVERSDISSLWVAVAQHADRNGDPEAAKQARWQAKQYRGAYRGHYKIGGKLT